MFVLRTGLQGNGKTLNTIKEVDAKAAKEGREVFYHNIRGFNPTAEILQAVWTEFDKPQEWFKLPNNAIIVIDEAQTFFRIRNQASAVPAYASALETMRHSGHELHCITQNPGLIDHHFRKLCNSHIHYVRGHKGQVIKRWEFERVNMDVEKKNTFTDGQATRILIDKKYFGVYQSVAEGSEHHMRFKPPRALFVFIACVLGIGYFGYGIYDRRIAPTEQPAPVAEPVTPAGGNVPAASPAQPKEAKPLTASEYVAMRIPRIPDVPSSAPIYDELTKPQSYPRLSCMMSSDESYIARNAKRYRVIRTAEKAFICECFTQQGSWHQTTFGFCKNTVERGAFDPARPDPTPNPQLVNQPPQQSPNPPQEAATGPRLVHIPYEKGRFLW